MKRLLLFSFFAAVALGATAQDLTVASYNVRYRNDSDAAAGNAWEQRCPWLCALVEFEDLDIFGAQEVLHPQLRDMVSRLDDYKYIGVGRDDGRKKGEYAPIFYKPERFKLLDDGVFWLSETPDRPSVGWDAALPRICTWGRFADRKTDRILWFFNLHMDHVGVTARAESARLVVRRIGEMCGKGDYVILTGDFNVDQHNEIYEIFTGADELCDSYDRAQRRYAPNGTFNAFGIDNETDSRIDHVFVTPRFRVRNYGVLTEVYHPEPPKERKRHREGDFPKEVSFHKGQARIPSDHFPVVVKLDYRN